jgi:hypothetical protein
MYLMRVISLIKSVGPPEFQPVESAIQAYEGLSLGSARTLDIKGKQLESSQTFKALLDKLPADTRRPVLC